jgi:hypothetical protein
VEQALAFAEERFTRTANPAQNIFANRHADKHSSFHAAWLCSGDKNEHFVLNTRFYFFFRAVFKFEGSSIVCSAKGEGFDDFRAQFSDEERAFGYLRLQVII